MHSLPSLPTTSSAKPVPTHALCLCGAEGTGSITEARSGGIMSQVEDEDDPAANPLAFRRDEAPLNPPVPLQFRCTSQCQRLFGLRSLQCMMSRTGFG